MRTACHEVRTRESVPVVGTVVLHWGARAATEACLESLRAAAYPAVRVFLVDNARCLDDATAQRAAPLPVEILRPPRNLGFAEGCDWGIAAALEAGADYVFLLNNDAVVSPQCLATLVSVARSTSRAGILSPQIAFQEATDRVWYRGGEFSLWGRGPRHTGWRERVETDRPPADVDYATGCAMLIDSAVIRAVGAFDARLFAYCEDVEFSLRARRAGFRALVVPAALVHHATLYTDRRRAQRVYYSIRNLLEVMRKHARWYHWISFVPAFAVQWVGFFLLLACRQRQWGLARAVGRGLLDGVQGRLGERSTWAAHGDEIQQLARTMEIGRR
jgi:GT2 family glycosyltransferase